MSQNLNSLNISTHNRQNAKISHFKQKMSAILSKKCDFIFLQDVRAASKISTIQKIITCTSAGNYKLLFNSSLAKRGVCILYKASIDIKILECFKSDCQNLILIKCVVNNVLTCLGSAYGPRDCDNPNFMHFVRCKIEEMNVKCHILAGDMNCLASNVRLIADKSVQAPNRARYYDTNPDCVNMSAIPNISNTNHVCDGISDGFWIDPFRSLNPNKRDYSYTPFQKNLMNRSRIDFFLISPNLLSHIDLINYEPLLTKLFDHKAVVLKIDIKNRIREPRIDNKFIKYPGMKEEAALTALRLYAATTDLPLEQVVHQLTQVVNDLQNIVVFKVNLIKVDALVEQFCLNLVEQFSNILSTTYSWEILSEANNVHEPDLLFETLQNNIKMALITFQSRISKSESSFEKKIISQLNNLKNDPHAFAVDIYELEDRINDFYDHRNLIECEKDKNWCLFNLEKPTRNYCNLTKGSNKLSSLDSIKDTSDPDSKKIFKSKDDRNTYIKEYFENIYMSNGPRTSSINQFLGDDIVNSQYVKDKILTDLEKDSIEGPISVQELTESLSRANLGSAPGCDGWSYKAIHFLWSIFKYALCKGFNHMTTKGSLMYSFGRVQIKLLPKKGDPENIKNFRPISLLSNFYKLCSSSFNQRMLLFANKITSIKQKAYSKTKVGHEGVINILDNIRKAIDNNANLAIILLDFSKAFDMLEHDLIEETFKFFGFGPHMLRILKTIITGRMGGIITKEGLTELFNFLSGNGQGDSSSATIFIFCIELLLIRLKLDPLLEKVIISDPRSSVGPETLETSGYADDITTFIDASAHNLEMLKTLFNEFFLLSGLELNHTKTTVIPVATADNDVFRQDIAHAGFNCDNSFQVMGFEIDNKLINLHVNIDNIFIKMGKIANFWDKIHMSIIGKITVAKTFLISQISYICTIIPTREADFRAFDKIIANFLTKKSQIAEKLVFLPVHKGGLGLFRTKEFIEGIRLGLFKRSLNNADTWALAIKDSRISDSDPFNLDLNHDSLLRNPHAKLIASAVRPFADNYFNLSGNCLKARIFDNISVFRNNLGSPLKLADLDRATRENNEIKLKSLRPFDILNINSLEVLQKNIIEARHNLYFTEADYTSLKTFINYNLHKMRKNFASPCTNLMTFFNSVKKGSKKYRQILMHKKMSLNIVHNGLLTRKKYIQLLDPNLELDNVTRDVRFFSTFNAGYLPATLRANFYMYLNNYTKLNSQISKFDLNINPMCSLCIANNIANPENESLRHFITNCVPFDNYITPIYNILVPNSSLLEKKIIFCLGFDTPNNSYNILGNTCTLLLFNYILFRRRSKFIAQPEQTRDFILSHLDMAMTASVKFYRNIRKSSTFLNNVFNDQTRF